MFTWCSSPQTRKKAFSPSKVSAVLSPRWSARIYRNDRLHIYEQKDEQRGLLRQEAEARMATLIGQMATGTLQSDKLELLVTDLAQRFGKPAAKASTSSSSSNHRG